MFLSKIWFFLVAVVAALAITVALVMPRPAERASLQQEAKGIRTACLVTNILLRDSARARMQLTSEFAQAVRQLPLSKTIADASKGEIVSAEANAAGRKELANLLDSVSGTKPSFIWLLDQRGRIVARSNLEDRSFGDSVRGYYLVRDALAGYVRDDLWNMEDGLYRVAAAPLLTRELDWAGAIVLGQAVDKDFAQTLSENINANINFYVGGDAVASNTTVQIHNDVIEGAKSLSDVEEGQDCAASEVLRVKAASDRYTVVSARLPGEAGEQGAFYSVYVQQEDPLDFMGMLKAAKKDDLGFDRFPWIGLTLLFVALVGVGFFLMIFEVDGPLKRLNKDAVALAQSEKERLEETAHRAKYGSIARSVNIAIDKMQRDAKAAKKDLDQLLGPAPGGSGVSPLPPIGPGGDGGAMAPPPPSEFKFGAPAASDLGLAPPPPSDLGFAGVPAVPTPTPPPSPVPRSMTPPPPLPSAKLDQEPAPLKRPTNSRVVPDPVSLPGPLDTVDSELGEGEATRLFEGPRGSVDEELPTVANDEEGYFRQIYREFIALKEQCGESVENLTFDRFRKKLQKNQDALIAKHACKSVKFQVYEKDGKAALKASPVK